MLSNGEFFEQLVALPVSERIDFLRSADYDIYLEAQPEAIVSWFHDIQDSQDIHHLADALMLRIGPIVLSREQSAVEGKMMTIMDVLSNPEDTLFDLELTFDMLDIFQIAGFVFADEIDSRVLIKIYLDCPTYARFIDDITVTYDYDTIATEHDTLSRELQEYFFHPTRIAEWIAAGKDIEDYLN